jgi:hypothetical protein
MCAFGVRRTLHAALVAWDRVAATATAAAMGTTPIIITGITAAMNENCSARSVRRPLFTLLAALLMLGTFSTLADSEKPGNLDGFAKCLAEKKATMYGSFLCPHCDDQKKVFGSSFQYVPYIECSIRGSRQMTFSCIAAQIRYTPTWVFDGGDRLVGFQPLKSLSEKTGCKLP